jgi:glycosyltransferase involved in cell wall biosynthesis
MNIVHIYKDYFPVFGGIENLMREMAEAQTRSGHTVTALVTQLPGSAAETVMHNGVTVVKAARQLNVQSAPISVSFPREVARLTAGADIAHLHAPYPIGEACNLWFGKATRTVISWHSDIVRQKMLLRVYGPVLRRVIRHADAVIASSRQYAESSPWLQPMLSKVSVAPYGVDAERFSPGREVQAASVRAAWLEQIGTSAGPAPMIVLGVGRLRYYKGFDDLLRAVAQLPDVAVVIAGIGPMQSELQALARSLGLGARALFAGEPDDAALPAFYRAADVFALPSNSRAESFGVVIAEAMASGLPAVTTEVGSATSWITQHEQTGLVVAPRDPQALAAALGRMRNDALRVRMGAAARERVLAEFTHARMNDRVEAIYREVAARAR